MAQLVFSLALTVCELRGLKLFNHSLILFVLLLHVPVNSYGHYGTVSSSNYTSFLGKLKQVVNQYFVHILSLVTDNNPS